MDNTYRAIFYNEEGKVIAYTEESNSLSDIMIASANYAQELKKEEQNEVTVNIEEIPKDNNSIER